MRSYKSKFKDTLFTDDQSAKVDGIVTTDGSFDGHITTNDDVFYIEPTNRYATQHNAHS